MHYEKYISAYTRHKFQSGPISKIVSGEISQSSIQSPEAEQRDRLPSSVSGFRSSFSVGSDCFFTVSSSVRPHVIRGVESFDFGRFFLGGGSGIDSIPIRHLQITESPSHCRH